MHLATSSFLSEDEIKAIGFKRIGQQNRISSKCSFYNVKNISIGDGCRIDDFCILSSGKGGIEIGDYVHLGNNVSLTGQGKITISDYVGLSSKVSVFSSTDDYSGEYMSNPCVQLVNPSLTRVYSRDIYIGKHALVGCGSTLLPDTYLADGISIGSMSLVNHRLTSIGLYQGNPLKFVKNKSLKFFDLEKQYFGTETRIIPTKNETNSALPLCKNIHKIFQKYRILIDDATITEKTLYEIGMDSLSQIQFQSELMSLFGIDIDVTQKIADIVKHIESANINIKPVNSPILFNNSHEQKSENKTTKLDSILSSTISILGVGRGLPLRKINNTFYESIVDTNDEWISSRTGMKDKYIVEESDDWCSIIVTAIQEAVDSSNIQKEDIDLLILATSTPTDLFGDASRVAYESGCHNAFGMDVTVACNGFITAIVTAENFIKAGKYQKAIVIGADCLSQWVNWNDRNSCILFGDGVGAVVLGWINGGEIHGGIIDHFLKTDGSKSSILHIRSKLEKVESLPSSNLYCQRYGKIEMSGTKVYEYIIQELPQCIQMFMDSSPYSLQDISTIILHQANARILKAVADKLGISEHKMMTNIDCMGNTSAASIPLLLYDCVKDGKMKKGDLVLFGGFGAGMSIGLFLMKWTMEHSNFIPPPFSPKVENRKIVLVTGGTKGIGWSITNEFAKHGYHVIMASRTNHAKDMYTPFSGIEFMSVDVTNENQLVQLKNYIETTFGQIHVLVNNAGWEGPEEKFLSTTMEYIDKIVSVNITSVLKCCNIFHPLVRLSGGSIINISSLASGDNISNCFRRTLYSTTKTAVTMFTRGLAGELKDICNVYSIHPSFVETDLTERIAKDVKIDKKYLNKLGVIQNDTSLIQPWEVGYFTYLLVTENTRYISGDEILIFSSLRTSYMQPIYHHLDNRDPSLKIKLDDIEEYRYVCFFQGQGVPFNIFNIDWEQPDIHKIFYEKNVEENVQEITNKTWSEIVKENKSNPRDTYFQQIIVYVYSVLSFLAKKQTDHRFKYITSMVGYSLGEITALTCSEILTFEDGLRIVHTRGSMMKTLSKDSESGMMTILGFDTNALENFISSFQLSISNDLTDTIKVVSGLCNNLVKCKEAIFSYNECNPTLKIKVKDLDTDGAFHTRQYEKVADVLSTVIKTIKIKSPESRETSIKVYSNYQGKEYTEENMEYLLTRQVCHMVDWKATMETLSCEKNVVYEPIEIGPSPLYLTNLYKPDKFNTKNG